MRKRVISDLKYSILDLAGVPDGKTPAEVFKDSLELARLVRRLPHRRRTPIIMLSAGDCETEAWRAGVNAFLRKPNDVLRVADVVARLVGQN